MREIKFRIFNKIDKIMIYEFEIDRVQIINGNLVSYVDDEVMQYTGFKDAKGTEIYEGDVLGIGEVFFNEEQGAYYVYKEDYYGNEDMLGDFFPLNSEEEIIIGNIYENPELRKRIV